MNQCGWMLAASDFDDWIQIAIAALVVVGSVLGPALKKLIAKFGPEPSSKKEDIPRLPAKREREMPPASLPGAPARRYPARPVARAMPGHPQGPTVAKRFPVQAHPPSHSEHRRPVALPQAAPVPVLPSVKQVSPSRGRPVPPGGLSPVTQPATTGSRRPTHHRHESKGTRAGQERQRRALIQKKETIAKKKVITHHTELQQVTVAPRHESEMPDDVYHLTLPSLRRGIILAEILSPPLALRFPDDRI